MQMLNREAELTTSDHYVLLHRPGDQAREDLRELTQWILSEFREAEASALGYT
jgi:hypothetical protein